MDLNPRPLHKRLGTLPLRLAKELFVKPTFPILCQQFASSIVPSPGAADKSSPRIPAAMIHEWREK